MRRMTFWMAVAAVVVGCQPAPLTKPRILSVQTPAGMPPAPSLKTTRNNPLIVPTAPVGRAGGVVAAPAIAVPVPQPPPGVIAPPANAIQVPAVPGVQGVVPPNTIAPPPANYQTPVIVTPAPSATTTSKQPVPLPGPVADSTEKSKVDGE